MSSQLIDRAGIFKVRPTVWHVYRADNSKSVAINIRFDVLAGLVEGQWVDWVQYGDWHVYGSYWIVGRDGKINSKTVKQLAESLGWKGSLPDVESKPPPDVMVQVAVKEDTYNGKTSFKAGWMNPGDYEPEPLGEDAGSVRDLDAQFGSALRAAASGVAAKAKPTGAPKPPRRVNEAVAPLGTGEVDDTPF